ncbi:copper transpport protein [Malassezia sp. CBS 17886]|nr:copper transpport protein [Malassezia sp. CBS 17886]
MIWNSLTRGLCVVHPAWNIQSSQTFVFSLLLVFLLSAYYEHLKWTLRCVDAVLASVDPGTPVWARMKRGTEPLEGDAAAALAAARARTRAKGTRRVIPLTNADVSEDSDAADASRERRVLPFFLPSSLQSPGRINAIRALLYGVQVAIACFLMLVMMTYNSWFISAIVAGAILGSFCFNRTPDGRLGGYDDKGAVCH